MAYCVKCGAKVDDGIRFCPYCGAEIPLGQGQYTSRVRTRAGRDSTVSRGRMTSQGRDIFIRRT